MAEIADRQGQVTPPQLNFRQVLVVMTGLLLGMLLAALDQTIVATALPTIAGAHLRREPGQDHPAP